MEFDRAHPEYLSDLITAATLAVRAPKPARRAHCPACHGTEHRGAFAPITEELRRWWDQEIHKVGRRLIGNDAPGTDRAAACALLRPLHQALTDEEPDPVAAGLFARLGERTHRRAA